MRKKVGTWFIWMIMGMIALVFVFYAGVNNSGPSGQSGYVGEVNGDQITIPDYNRALQQRRKMAEQFGGGELQPGQKNPFEGLLVSQMLRGSGIPPQQAQRMSLEEAVFQELVTQKLRTQNSRDLALAASPAALVDEVKKMSVFQEGGQFDVIKYRKTLEANSLTADQFERMIADDLIAKNWDRFFTNVVHVSDAEIEQEYILQNDKRYISYVYITNDKVKKLIKVTPTDVKKYLADPTKMELVKNRFNTLKEFKYKGKKFEAVQNDIAGELITNDRHSDIDKLRDELAEKVKNIIKPGKGNQTADALLKPLEISVQTGKALTRSSDWVPGVGEVKELFKDAFTEPSSISKPDGGSPKIYKVSSGVIVAVMEKAEKADLSKLDESTRLKLIENLVRQKKSAIEGSWMKELRDTANLKQNDALLKSASTSRG